MAPGKTMARVRRLSIVVCLIFVVLVLCDPLYRFAFWLSYTVVMNPMWVNGLSSVIDLPASASIEDVMKDFTNDRYHNNKVIEIRRIWMLGTLQPYWAARVEENGRAETLLIHYSSEGHYSESPNSIKPEKGFWEIKGF